MRVQLTEAREIFKFLYQLAINQNELYIIACEVTSKEELDTSEGWRKYSDQTLAWNC